MVHKDPEKHVVTETESESFKELMKVGGKHEETVEHHTKEQDGVEGMDLNRKDINNMLRFKQKPLPFISRTGE